MTIDDGRWVKHVCALPSLGQVHPMAIIQDIFAYEREENDSYFVVAHHMKNTIKKHKTKQRVNPCILYLYFIVPHTRHLPNKNYSPTMNVEQHGTH